MSEKYNFDNPINFVVGEGNVHFNLERNIELYTK